MKYYLLLIFVLTVWAFLIEPNLLFVKYYKVKNLNGNKIVFVSDFHIAKYDKWRLKRIVKKINELNPDLVLSGGDYINGYSGKHTLDIIEQAKELTKIKAPVISVLGNHDAHYDKYSVQKALEKHGITVLRNSNTKFKNIYIAGIEDLQTSISDLDAALEGTELPRILISHTPDIYYDVKQDVDLILAGHVHGGQIKLPFFGALICPSKYGTRFSDGDFKELKNRMIVTKGLGTSILSMRFNNAPEIVVIEE